ncbi:hypothetical protein DE146DRAFT_398656 [Phaeosphaeria sp. MPI-PUGE-AT-0046c]|nr:hypothetical protein DE146DRAFT_398656 [Phaeosphaeria sp. MPI-PUGE-AT-0046c]
MMADPLSITASIVAIATAAIQSVKSLNDTVSRYKGRDKTLQRLQNELEDVSGILDSLKEAILAEVSISTLLKGPVGRCSEVCREFEQSMQSFGEKTKTGIRDWAKLEFMRGDINEFIDTISGYKSTIAVGLGIITLSAAKVSQETLKEYNEMIQNTMHDLNIHLQRVDEKLKDFSISSSQTSGINLSDEKAVTKQCLRICEDSQQFLESLRKSSVLGVHEAVEDQHHDSFEAQLLTRQLLDTNRDGFINIITQLRSRLEFLVFENSPENNQERSRLLDDINASKQCLEICKVASEVSSQKIYRVGEVTADGESDQVVVNTLADLFDVKKAVSKDRSAQLVGSMSGEDLRFLAEKRYGSRFGAMASEHNSPNHSARTTHTEQETRSTSHQANPASSAPPRPKQEKPSSNEFRKRVD